MDEDHDERDRAPVRRRSDAVDAFVKQARAIQAERSKRTGRLILALDATMSRQPTWDLACTLQGRMFDAVQESGGLEVQLVYFRGLGECRASRYAGDAATLKSLMERIECRGGHTQIGKVLSHALSQDRKGHVGGIVFIGDAMEERADDLCERAGELGLRGVPIFLFQEGRDPAVRTVFAELARLSKGALFRFDRDAPAHLAGLLSSIALYATGGLAALSHRDRAEDRLLLAKLGGGGA